MQGCKQGVDMHMRMLLLDCRKWMKGSMLSATGLLVLLSGCTNSNKEEGEPCDQNSAQCGAPNTDQQVRDGTAKVLVSLPHTETASTVTRVELAVSGPNMALRQERLANAAGTWKAVLTNLPAGTERTFRAEAFDVTNALVYSGQITGIAIDANQTTQVAMALHHHLTSINRPPQVVETFQSTDVVTTNLPITLRVKAQDPQGSVLSFAWQASSGELGTPETSANLSEVAWTPPACTPRGASALITLTVTNVLNLAATSSFRFTGGKACAEWIRTGNMVSSRYFHASTVLPSGKVLVTGGRGGDDANWLNSAETFDPVTGTWTLTGSMATPRFQHSMTVLPSGKVLVAGGYNGNGVSQTLASSELYDPSTGTWAPTGSMARPRSGHIASLLASGKVLVAGGAGVTAELYDPTTGTWTPTGNMVSDHYGQGYTVSVLPFGRLLVTGGGEINSGVAVSIAEIYDPETGTWTQTSNMSSPRTYHTAVVLPSGKVLVAGGWYDGAAYASAEVYDPMTGTWSSTQSMSSPRFNHTATGLPSGKLLIAGGTSFSTNYSSAELYDTATGTWAPTAGMASPRWHHSATSLPSGGVMVAGDWFDGTDGVEIYVP